MKLGLLIFGLAVLTSTGLAEETRQAIRATQFEPAGETVIAKKFQVYPVLIIHDEPVPRDVPTVYLSLFLRDCSDTYLSVKDPVLEVDIPGKAESIRFVRDYAENDGVFMIPFAYGIDEGLLNEEGRAMLRTKGTSFLAKLGDPDSEAEHSKELRNSQSVKLKVHMILVKQNKSTIQLKHSFDLQPQETSMIITRYGNDNPPITHSVIIPEMPEACLRK